MFYVFCRVSVNGHPVRFCVLFCPCSLITLKKWRHILIFLIKGLSSQTYEVMRYDIGNR